MEDETKPAEPIGELKQMSPVELILMLIAGMPMAERLVTIQRLLDGPHGPKLLAYQLRSFTGRSWASVQELTDALGKRANELDPRPSTFATWAARSRFTATSCIDAAPVSLRSFETIGYEDGPVECLDAYFRNYFPTPLTTEQFARFLGLEYPVPWPRHNDDEAP